MVTIYYCLQSLYPVVLDTHHLLHTLLRWLLFLLLLLRRNVLYVYIYLRVCATILQMYYCNVSSGDDCTYIVCCVLYDTSVYLLPTVFLFSSYIRRCALFDWKHTRWCYCAHTSRKMYIVLRAGERLDEWAVNARTPWGSNT